ncbi:GNAT family N-acetyltransferase [uncultured Croceitalea sp.]|uniref:GNAT family N-acetyltransferase n=1 Tax=uncultured Croceitalea sp. TaxID=1798908 RepID=UPI003305DC78
MSKPQVFQLEINSFGSTNEITIYRELLEQLNCDSPYYCYELLNSSQNDNTALKCFIFSVDNEVIAVMPFFLRPIASEKTVGDYYDVSSPWGYNGPFFKEDTDEALVDLFWKEVDQWYHDNDIVSEFLRFNFYGNHSHYSGHTLHTLKNVRGDITDWDKFWSNLKPNTRNQFRKAEKIGLRFEFHHQNILEEKIKAFYEVYIGTMDRRDAIDSFYHKLEYFLAICSENPQKCAIGLVYQGDSPISCEFFLLSNDTIFSFLGGTSSNHFKLRPNEFLKISAIKWARENGIQFYMIGGGLSNRDDDNLYLYKKKYFQYDDDIDFFTGRKVVNNEIYLKLIDTRSEDKGSDTKILNVEEGFFPKYREKAQS